jgi:REP element-mobilizing transposase RayT
MSVSKIYYHIYTATNRRAPLITPDVEEVLFPAMGRAASQVGCSVVALNGCDDHVHLLVEGSRTVSVAQLMKVVKTAGSKAVRDRFGPDSFQWQSGYGVVSVSPGQLRRVFRYIKNQKLMPSEESGSR